ncbi:glycerol kinase [Lichtheimia corymbifera JMRC:FSU:9682]|uniref:glycerol kinase n=1 Tax=Lichtheimia corymbifera JMRC:FSU:9682 TaxID=1263082 RepID=A0A068SDP3_9FUNG|nr:glycerol kinase [Lichtheimia corymbifera JMRC:FSU:9682]
MPKLVGAIDQGTTSTRFVIFDQSGSIVALHQIQSTQHYPQPGWVEQDPYEMLDLAKACMEHAVRKLNGTGYTSSDIQAIGVTNQRETTLAWDKLTGLPLYPAIIWSDARTTETVQKLAATSDKGIDALRSVCGLPLTNYFSGVKMRWLLDNIPMVAEAQEQGRLQFGTLDTWLIYNLTGGAEQNGVLVTDVTNASRTMLMDIHTLQWSEEALSFFGLEMQTLPKIASSSQVYGTLHEGSLMGVPIAGCLGDQQAALVGQKCFGAGDAKNTYGTGCFMLFNTGNSPVLSDNGLISTVAYQFGDDAPSYALEGSVAVAGSSISWLRDNLKLISSVDQLNDLAAEVPDTAGVYFVTAFGGLFAPYWRDDARGTICGLTQFTTLHHLARATLEAVCYQSRAILDAMNKEANTPLRALKVDGGISNSDLCMQIQSDILGITVERPSMRESTALGSAMAAGLAVGVWESIHDLAHVNVQGKTDFTPAINTEKREHMYNGWQEAVKRSFGWTTSNPQA